MDLRDLFSGRMSWRRFALILERLPIESEYKTDLRNVTDLSSLPPPRPGVHGAWSQTDLLLARIGDRIGDLIFAQGGYQKQPPPMPRPGVEDNVRPISPAAQAYLEYLYEHHGAAPPDDWTPEVG